MLKWSFKALYEGRRPSEGHDGSGWGDAVWGRLVGVPLIRKGILVQVKADWEAFCNIMGFALWTSVFRPCLCCNVNKELLAEVTGITLEDAPGMPTRRVTMRLRAKAVDGRGPANLGFGCWR